MVLDLKILMYRNADEIERLKKIKKDSDQVTWNTVGRIEKVPKKVVVVASTSQVESGSDLSREKLELAFKLLEVSSCWRSLSIHFIPCLTLIIA